MGTGLGFARLALGGEHTCGLLSDGTAFCWGNNASGQLGDGTTTNHDRPVPVLTGFKFTSIDAGTAHTCALTSAGEAYCWGRNNRGQLGDGTIVDRLAPALVSGFTFQQIAAGGFLPIRGHTCGLATTGQTYCWGDNARGQLGVGSADLLPHPMPMPVSTGVTFASITAGLGQHSCGRTALGTAYCWGENTFGALGNETQEDSAIPVEVAGGRTFSQLIAGGFIGHTCALTGTGDAYCWGENERGQVGDGTTADRLAPTAVVGGLIFTSIDAGFRHTCGRDNTGALYCWGSGGAGQLGNNTNTQSNVPSKVFEQAARSQPPTEPDPLPPRGHPGLDGDAHARHRPRTGRCLRRHPAARWDPTVAAASGCRSGHRPFRYRLYPTSVQRNDLQLPVHRGGATRALHVVRRTDPDRNAECRREHRPGFVHIQPVTPMQQDRSDFWH